MSKLTLGNVKKISLVLSVALFLISCTLPKEEIKEANAEEKAVSNIGINAKSAYPTKFGRNKLESVPKYDPDSNESFPVDLRCYDLQSLDLTERYSDLIYSDFDSCTKWPDKLPEGFNPDVIMETAKNPGLGIRELHKRGITGEGIGIAVLDQNLLTNHIEYKDRLKFYEEINWKGDSASMHGSAVASIAVGNTVGVAPKADLYYIAVRFWEKSNTCDYAYLAKAVDRIIEINKELPAKNKIRVIAIARGWSPGETGYEEITEAVENAKKQGILVVSSSLFETHGFFFNGLGREPLKDPEQCNSYEPGLFWSKSYYEGTVYSRIEKITNKKIGDVLLVPMDSRTTASPTGENDYVFYRSGGWSWSIPYIAGLYALGAQVRPNLTPEVFWSKALETGDEIEIVKDAKSYKLGKIVNPQKLMESLMKQ